MAQQVQKLALFKPSRSEEIITEAEKEAALKKVRITINLMTNTHRRPVMFATLKRFPAFSYVIRILSEVLMYLRSPLTAFDSTTCTTHSYILSTY